MVNWKYVEKDGNPTEAGTYLVTLIHPVYKNNQIVGECATMDSRYFANLDEEPGMKNWTMDGEPESGFAWTMECGSSFGERVHAWISLEDIEIAELPDGVETEGYWNEATKETDTGSEGNAGQRGTESKGMDGQR